jgi:hypothetical protein
VCEPVVPCVVQRRDLGRCSRAASPCVLSTALRVILPSRRPCRPPTVVAVCVCDVATTAAIRQALAKSIVAFYQKCTLLHPTVLCSVALQQRAERDCRDCRALSRVGGASVFALLSVLSAVWLVGRRMLTFEV